LKLDLVVLWIDITTMEGRVIFADNNALDRVCVRGGNVNQRLISGVVACIKEQVHV
jgi:hypothetical protein